MGVVHLQSKKCQELQINTRSQKIQGGSLSADPSEWSRPANTLILDCQPLDLQNDTFLFALSHPSLWYFGSKSPRALVQWSSSKLQNGHLQSRDLNPRLSDPKIHFSQLLYFTPNELRQHLVEAINFTSFTDKVPLKPASGDGNKFVGRGREGRKLQTEIEATYERHKWYAVLQE